MIPEISSPHFLVGVMGQNLCSQYLLYIRSKIHAVLWPLRVYHQKHLLNLIVLRLFTVSISLPVLIPRMFFPVGSTTVIVYGGISAVICGYIVYNTDNLIQRFAYGEYILAFAALYLDILNLFIFILQVLRSADRCTVVYN
ncbi:hypothetical protein Patl1_11216 [Pistacia atlantica]|uniref:Uncharacterized protein n=1 Tax=Pistacia atlantica TaxID=434234 RepID=A0ACC0ZZY7_9ROSI|nr:hypothetical protein Patl1_11216 [Pistacia atlantica]